MWFSLLFDPNDQLVAAAPAVDVQQFGHRYWTEFPFHPLHPGHHGASATIEVTDPTLITMLNSLETSDEHLTACRTAIQRIVLDGASPAGRADRTRNTPRAA